MSTKWEWFLFIGIGLIVLGSLIISLSTSNTTSTRVGWMFIIVGIFLFIIGLFAEYSKTKLNKKKRKEN